MVLRKLVWLVGVFGVLVFSGIRLKAVETSIAANGAMVEMYISTLYKQIDFSNCDRLSYDVFNKACHGYLNLRLAGRLAEGREVLTICNFDLPSTANRMWVIDLLNKKVLFNTYVAHGQGTGDDCPEAFSNKFDSHQSSLGFYVTSTVYDGEHGASLRLVGVDQGFNDAALDRGIVVHGANYVSSKFVQGNQRLGRSWGCPAVPQKLALPIINKIQDSTCLFAYFPETNYLNSSVWLNKPISQVPNGINSGFDGGADEMALKLKDVNNPNPHTKPTPQNRAISKIEYVNNGKVDSVKYLKL